MARGVASARAGLYRFLSDVYLYPPNPDLIQRIVDEDFLEELSSLFGERAVADLRTFAATARIDGDLAPLRREFMALFAVPTGRYLTPFEDVYRGETVNGQRQRGPLLGERAVAVIRLYRAAGAEMARACKELPTHIGVELAFMAFLCEREAAAIHDEEGHAPPRQRQGTAAEFVIYRELQMRFLQEHLNTWFPQLRGSILANATGQLYRGLSLVTEAFLARDMANLLASSARSNRADSMDVLDESARVLGTAL
jgi:TorA maturation chaperone TorD